MILQRSSVANIRAINQMKWFTSGMRILHTEQLEETIDITKEIDEEFFIKIEESSCSFSIFMWWFGK